MNKKLKDMVSKKEISDVLKEAGLGNVKMDNGDWNHKTYKDHNGKMVKGIKGGSIGPMTMTDAHLKHNQNAVDKLIEKMRVLRPETVEQIGDNVKIIIQLSEKKNRELNFSWNLYPTNTPDMDLDPGYKTYWLTMAAKDTNR